MTKKIDRRQFIGTAVDVCCGCMVASSVLIYPTTAWQTGQSAGKGATEGEATVEGSIATGYCGIYCAACPQYLTRLKDPSQGCPGCNQGEVSDPCGIRMHAVRENLNACGEHNQFPCAQYNQIFNRGDDDSVIGVKNNYRIREVGYAAWLKEQGACFTKEASMAKLFASEMSERVCHRAIQIHGGYGYMREYEVERMYRDQRLCAIGEGTNEIQRLVIARRVLGN